MEDETSMEVDPSDGELFAAGPSRSSVGDENPSVRARLQPVASGSGASASNVDAAHDDSEWDEVVEESLIHVTVDNTDDTSYVHANSNVRVIAIDTDSPVLQIENKIFRLNEWKYIPGTAMFFEKTKEVKAIDPLYDNRCASVLRYVGSTCKCLEMTKKETTM